MLSVLETSPAPRHACRRIALALLIAGGAALVAFQLRAADSTLADDRATKSGKPLRFRAIESVGLDRDDQDQAARSADHTAPPEEHTNGAHSSDQTGLLTQMKFAPNSAFSETRKASYTDASPAAPRGAARAAYQKAEPPPEPIPSAPPSDSGRIIGPPRDNGSPNVLDSPNEQYSIERGGSGPLPPGMAGDAWPHDYLREQLAEPLCGASWCNEPFHIDWFIGMIRGTEIIRDHVDQNVGVIGGFRLGWDYDCYWGIESRLAFSSLEDQLETAPLVGSADKVILWDTSLCYYPWGDSRLRPYLSVGLGLAEFQFVDDFQREIRRNLVELPFGVGVKYRLHDWLVLRAEITDNLALGSSGLETMNNVSFTTGMEYRFGGCHRSYWPWEPAGVH